MRFRSIVFVPASLLVFMAALAGQSTPSQDLPSAPSTAKEHTQPKQTPDQTPTSPDRTESNPTPVQALPDAGKVSPSSPAQQDASSTQPVESEKPGKNEPSNTSQDDDSVSTIRRTVNE